MKGVSPRQFSNPECVAGSCADYAWGADGEPQEQEADQKAGKKIQVPTMVLYSAANLGRMHDVDSIWPKWTESEIKCVGIGEGYGHFLPEECPEICVKYISEWIDRFGK